MKKKRILKRQQNGFLKEKSISPRWVSFLWNWLPHGAFLCAALLLTICLLELPEYLYLALLPGLLCLGLTQMKGAWGKRLRAATILTAVILLFLMGSRQEYLQQGFLISVNHLLERLAEIFRFYPQLYETQTEIEAVSLLSFWSAIIVIFATIQGCLARQMPIFVRLIFAFLQMLLGIVGGAEVGTCLAFLASLLIWRQGRNGESEILWTGKGRMQAWIQGMGILMLTVFAAGCVCLSLSFLFGLHPESWVESAKEAVREEVRQVRYEKNPADSLPEGRLKGLGEWKATEDTALEVVMEEPQSVYLRGFVGSVYTGEGWEELEAKDCLERQDLFYWLHQSGFYGLGQLSMLNSLTGSDVRNVKVTVQNFCADSQYLYLPYEVNTPLNEFTESSSMADEAVVSRKLFGTRIYQFSMDKNLIKEYPNLASAFYEGGEELKDYTQAESYYNTFVYEHYLDMPEASRTLLQAQLSVESAKEGTHYSYEEANAIVMGYLDQQIEYEENPGTYTGSEDFLKWFLESNRKGYAVHYASAAVLMYRYLGIPARYVEGYLITPQMAEEAESYQPVAVTGENAHAWVEIYQDGVGWIPMEVTPVYRDAMERPEYALAPIDQGGQQEEGGNSGKAEEQIRDEETEPQREESSSRRNLPVKETALVILICVLLTLIICFFAREIRGRKKAKLRQRGFQNPDLDYAVTQIYAYIRQLLELEGVFLAGGSHYGYAEGIGEKFGTEGEKEFLTILPLVQKGIYSENGVTLEQKEQVEAYKDWILEEILKRKRFWQKLWLYWGSFMI